MKRARPVRPPLHRVCTAWLAVWLVFFAAFAPLVSHALAPGATPPGLEICTATGPQTLVVADDTAPTSPSGHLLAHCPFCLLQADRLALPSQALHFLPPDTVAVQVDAPVGVFTPPEPRYNSAAPRGPPAHS